MASRRFPVGRHVRCIAPVVALPGFDAGPNLTCQIPISRYVERWTLSPAQKVADDGVEQFQ